MRKYRRLTRADRIVIEKRLEQQKTQTEIAEELKVHRSTISREIKRNKSTKGPYRWRGAQAKAKCGRPHIQLYRRKIEGVLEVLVCHLLEDGLSPDQISKRLIQEEAKWRVSHETIYKWIYNICPAYKACLRWKSRCRQKRSGRKRRSLHKLPRKMIDERLISANLREEPGHWERDLLEGRRGGPALLVIQDRHTRLTLIRKVQSKNADEVNSATVEALRNEVVRSITNDNGVEFGKFDQLEAAIKAPVYFCHAYTSWERGMVENTNGLLRQYLPKKMSFEDLSPAEVNTIQNVLNRRPRKMLGYKSPMEIQTGRAIKLIRSESYYRKAYWQRYEEEFKRAMIRETGQFLTKSRDGIVALNY